MTEEALLRVIAIIVNAINVSDDVWNETLMTARQTMRGTER